MCSRSIKNIIIILFVILHISMIGCKKNKITITNSLKVILYVDPAKDCFSCIKYGINTLVDLYPNEKIIIMLVEYDNEIFFKRSV